MEKKSSNYTPKLFRYVHLVDRDTDDLHPTNYLEIRVDKWKVDEMKYVSLLYVNNLSRLKRRVKKVNLIHGTRVWIL